MYRFFFFLLTFAFGGVLIWFFGPREPFSGEVFFGSHQLGEDLDVYLTDIEGRIPDIREGLQKQIIWANPAQRQKTDLAIVYIHGFTASLGEIRPVPDKVAETLEANLFFTRLKGHGRTGKAMGDASVDDWLQDVAEAISIGSRLGEQVLVMSTSTGGALVSWLAANKPEWAEKIAGHIMISPNFRIADPKGFLLTWPFARYFVPAIAGDMRGKRAADPKVAHFWTNPHVTVSLMPMAKITEEAAKAPLERIEAPALIIYSSKDKVVVPQAIENASQKWGGPVERLIIDRSGHKTNHVITGDLLSPETTHEAISMVAKWIQFNFR